MLDFIKSPRVKRDLELLDELEMKEASNKRRFMQTIRKERTNKILMICSTVAAAVVLIFFGSNILMNEEESPVVAESQELLKVSADTISGVRLVLSSGEVVSLGSGEMKNIEDGGTKIAAQNDKGLKYASKKRAADSITYNTIIVPKGEIYNVTLADGTTVTINSDSKLTFPTTFVGDKREVKLEGEAFFRVKRDVNHPFLVVAGELTTNVLGTEFNVTVYPEMGRQSVTLVSGLVAVDVSSKHSEVLKPGSMLSYELKSGQCEIRDVEVDDVTAWMNGELVFIHENIEDIVRKLSRRFNVSMICDIDSELSFYYRASGVERVEDVLNAFKISGKITYSKNEKGIYIIKSI